MVENVTLLNSGTMISVNVSVNSMKDQVCKGYVWNPSICDCEIVKYLYSMLIWNNDDLVITCDEIIGVTKSYSNTPGKVSFNLLIKKTRCTMDYYIFWYIYLLLL